MRNGKGGEMTAEQAYQRLTALCARSEHCQHDMLEKMRQWGLAEAEQAQVMERLTRERYVDDERFCRAFVSDKVRQNKWGRRKVEQALWLKHIDSDTAKGVLDEIDADTYIGTLRPLLRQRRRTMRGLNDYEQRTKLVKWALSRGFTMDVIRECIDTSDVDADDSDTVTDDY